MYVHSGRLVGPFVTRENRGLGVATPSAPLLACAGMMYLLWNAVLSLHQMYQDPCLPSSTSDSLVHRTLCQKALGSLMCFWQLCNGPLCSSWWFLPCNYLMNTILSHLFLMMESWTLTLTEASEACGSSDVHLNFFVPFWMSHCFGKPATPGKIQRCSKSSRF